MSEQEINEFTDSKITEEISEIDIDEEGTDSSEEDTDNSYEYIDISEEGKNMIADFIKTWVLEIHNDIDPKRQQLLNSVSDYVADKTIDDLVRNNFDECASVLYDDESIHKLEFVISVFTGTIMFHLDFFGFESVSTEHDDYLKFKYSNSEIYIEEFSKVLNVCNNIFPRFKRLTYKHFIEIDSNNDLIAPIMKIF